MDYNSSSEVLAGLTAIFPDFAKEWEADNPYIWDGEFSIHSVYMTFLDFLPAVSPNADQLQKTASFINEAVDAGGNSENAISTCFLEHVNQVRLGPKLKPLLTKEARRRLRP